MERAIDQQQTNHSINHIPLINPFNQSKTLIDFINWLIPFVIEFHGLFFCWRKVEWCWWRKDGWLGGLAAACLLSLRSSAGLAPPITPQRNKQPHQPGLTALILLFFLSFCFHEIQENKRREKERMARSPTNETATNNSWIVWLDCFLGPHSSLSFILFSINPSILKEWVDGREEESWAAAD